MKKIFLDLDECLVNSHYISDKFNKEEAITIANTLSFKFNVVNGYSYNFSFEEYISFVRPHAQDFVKRVEDEFGKENVRILTQSIESYAVPICEHFFGIKGYRVLDRDDIRGKSNVFEDYECLLVDNLPQEDPLSEAKIKFLGTGVKYHQIHPYDIYSHSDGHREEFDRMVKLLKDEL